jgi:integrase
VYLTFPELKEECKTSLVLKAPKTTSSVRTVYISKTVAEALLELKAEQERQKEALHGLYEDYNMVIALSNGRPVERRLIDKAFKTHIAAQGLTPIVFHSLRHFSTSMKLALCGDIKAVQGDTGHATADMVTGVYGHAFRSNRQQLAADMEEYFFQPIKQSAAQDEKMAQLSALLGAKPELLDLLLAAAK